MNAVFAWKGGCIILGKALELTDESSLASG